MAQYKKKRSSGRPRSKKAMQAELKQDLAGIALLALGLFAAFCLWQVPASGDANILGALGTWVYKMAVTLFGKGKWFLAIALVVIGASRWFGGISFNSVLVTAYIVLALSCCAIGHLILPAASQTYQAGLAGQGGGLIGGVMVQGSNFLIGSTGSWILYIALIVASLLLITGKTVREIMADAGDKASTIVHSAQESFSSIAARSEERRNNREKGIISSLNLPTDTELREDKGSRRGRKAAAPQPAGPVRAAAAEGSEVCPTAAAASLNPVQALANREIEYKIMGQTPEELAAEEAAVTGEAAGLAKVPPTVTAAKSGIGFNPNPEGTIPFKGGAKPIPSEPADQDGEEEDGEEQLSVTARSLTGEAVEYKKPPIDILGISPRIKSQRLNKDITDNVRVLEETLASFGVKAVVTQVNRGPSITRFELQPAPGVKVSRIVNLSDDIALAMAAAHIRIEAPIPGKAAVGIEVPNAERTQVSLREILEDPAFKTAKSKLTFALGRDIAGAAIVADLAKMPHLLIAGSTGSGKSVCMNALIASILFNSTPDEVKLMMVDPKMVELSNYNGIPHLIHPVVTDPKKAAKALRWAVHEMEKRYDTFSKAGVKDITRYNEWLSEQIMEDKPAPMPQVVILIDELADLMLVAPADVEDAICRLAQMARAAGMHLVVATQRPSVDVITGIIKANIPSRIAFAVSSQTDSRVILDMAGAEKLLGRGDMLYYTLERPKPVRVQGVFVSDKEIDGLVTYLKNQGIAQPAYMEELTVEVEEAGDGEEEALDSLLPEAAKIFIESGQASISLLQRRLRVGYTRAARIIDQMEEQGIVGGFEGSKARAIRMTMEQYEERFGKSGPKAE